MELVYSRWSSVYSEERSGQATVSDRLAIRARGRRPGRLRGSRRPQDPGRPLDRPPVLGQRRRRPRRRADGLPARLGADRPLRRAVLVQHVALPHRHQPLHRLPPQLPQPRAGPRSHASSRPPRARSPRPPTRRRAAEDGEMAQPLRGRSPAALRKAEGGLRPAGDGGLRHARDRARSLDAASPRSATTFSTRGGFSGARSAASIRASPAEESGREPVLRGPSASVSPPIPRRRALVPQNADACAEHLRGLRRRAAERPRASTRRSSSGSARAERSRVRSRPRGVLEGVRACVRVERSGAPPDAPSPQIARGGSPRPPSRFSRSLFRRACGSPGSPATPEPPVAAEGIADASGLRSGSAAPAETASGSRRTRRSTTGIPALAGTSRASSGSSIARSTSSWERVPNGIAPVAPRRRRRGFHSREKETWTLFLAPSRSASVAPCGRRKRRSVRVFVLKHKRVEEAALLIRPHLSDSASVTLTQRLNAMTVTDREENLEDDRPGPRGVRHCRRAVSLSPSSSCAPAPTSRRARSRGRSAASGPS